MHKIINSVILIVGLITSLAQALDYPNRSITIFNPYSPGGSADLQARIIAEFLEKEFKQPISIVSKAGGAGAVGMIAAKKAKNDGYSLIFTANGPSLLTPNLNKAGYNTVEDFIAIAQVSSVPYSLSTLPKSNIHNMEELFAAAKEKQNLTYSTVGAHMQFVMERLFNDAGVKITHIPAQGAAGTKTALLGEHINLAVLSLPDAIPFFKTKEFNVLAVTGASASPALPGVQTLKDQNIDMVTGAWFGFLAPKGVDPEIVDILQNAIEKSLKDKEVQEKLTKFGLTIDFKSSQDFSNLIKAEYQDVKVSIAQKKQKSTQ